MFSLFGKSFDPAKDIPDLSGKVIIVTGGNTGLGKESVLQLVKHNPKEVYLAARTASKAEAAIAEIKNAVPNASVSFLQLDLTDFASIKNAAEQFTSRNDRLDILLNNAGIMALPYDKTAQGYEIQFGTNHMGHALLTKLLLPTLLKTAESSPDADVRIVNLSSEGHMLAPSGGILFDQVKAETYNTWARYGSAKLANILHARALQKRHPQLTVTSVHPGVIQTDLFAGSQRNSAIIRYGIWAFGGMFMQNVAQGARNQLWACTAPKSDVATGYYWTPVGKRSAGSGNAKDEKLADRLWEYTEEEFKKQGF
ncbi:hypothetical protein MBLNU459_g6122t1 [Dothideomycetes sp. NU459]